jgi:hypothetical protein
MQAAHYDSYSRVLSPVTTVGDLAGAKGTRAGGLAALEYFGYYHLRSNGTLTGLTDSVYGEFYGYESSGNLVNQHIVLDPLTNSSYGFRWKNATDDILWTLHDVMLRMAWECSSG